MAFIRLQLLVLCEVIKVKTSVNYFTSIGLDDSTHVVCGAGSMKLSSVRPSHHLAAARHCSGFAAVGPAATSYWSIAARLSSSGAAAANDVGSWIQTCKAHFSTIVLFLFLKSRKMAEIFQCLAWNHEAEHIDWGIIIIMLCNAVLQLVLCNTTNDKCTQQYRKWYIRPPPAPLSWKIWLVLSRTPRSRGVSRLACLRRCSCNNNDMMPILGKCGVVRVGVQRHQRRTEPHGYSN